MSFLQLGPVSLRFQSERVSRTYQPSLCMALYSREGQFRLTEGSGEILEGVDQVYHHFVPTCVT